MELKWRLTQVNSNTAGCSVALKVIKTLKYGFLQSSYYLRVIGTHFLRCNSNPILWRRKTRRMGC